MIIGAAYYPEHWDRKRWETDCRLMRDMGINTVRMGEFGWSVMEREEGKLDFSLYDEAIGLLWEYGISTILGTPTATPPARLCETYPDIYMEDRDGQVRGFGSRRHYCYRHKGYLWATAKIVRAMAEHYKDDKRVIAWQIDNELGCEDEVRCYCEDCRETFSQWLKRKYKSLDALNEAWGTVFWSQIYTKWEQIVLPRQTVVDPYTGNGHNPGLLLDFAEFSSDSLIEFAKIQCDVLRSLTDKPIVHNVVSEYCDNYKLTALLDGAGYVRSFVSVVMPLIRPILATLCIFSAVGQWNSFTDTMMLMPSGNYQTLQYLLYKYQREAESLATLIRNTQDANAIASAVTKQTSLSVQMTVAMVVTLPILLVYPYFQRYFVKGITIGAVKG